MKGVRHLWRWATGYVLAGGVVSALVLACSPAIWRLVGAVAGSCITAVAAAGVIGALLGLHSALREYRRWAEFEQQSARALTAPRYSASGWKRVGPGFGAGGLLR